MKNWKKALFLTLIIAGILVVVAVLLGILNATVLDGAINLGWTDYRYDNEDAPVEYNRGEGSVFSERITSISVDWLEGNVRVEVCEDTFISLSEQSEEPLNDADLVHWYVFPSEGGDELMIKSRESGSFFGGTPEKDLILRIPKSMLSQIGALVIKSHDGDVTLEAVSAHALNVECTDGDIRAHLSSVPQLLSIVAKDGQVQLLLPKNADFLLYWTKNSGVVVSDVGFTTEGGAYRFGAGGAQFYVTTDDTDLFLTFAK